MGAFRIFLSRLRDKECPCFAQIVVKRQNIRPFSHSYQKKVLKYCDHCLVLHCSTYCSLFMIIEDIFYTLRPFVRCTQSSSWGLFLSFCYCPYSLFSPFARLMNRYGMGVKAPS
jgi:hypothetical protein